MVLVVALVCAIVGTVSAGLSVYTDSLQGWTDYSWPPGAAIFGATSPVQSGTKAIAVTVAQWQALSLHTASPISGSAYSAIRSERLK